MSPTEHELRAALRHGEGEPVDVDRLLAAGVGLRAQRRSRLLTVATSVVIVAAAAVTGTALLTRDDGTSPTSNAQAQQASPTGRSAAGAGTDGGGGGVAAPAPGSSRVPIVVPDAGSGVLTCPAGFPRRMLPGGGSPGQFGADSPLFERTPTAVAVCAYSGAGTLAARTVLTGRDATALRISLESAPKVMPSCPIGPPAVVRKLAFVGVDAAGRSMRVVTTDVADSYCDARTTNGTAVRYGWTPPASLNERLGLLGASVAPRPSPTGKNIGSPVR
jgi:hypothetical protein